MMRQTLIFALMTMMVLAPAVFSQDALMRVGAAEESTLTRPVVVFPHERHESVIACGRCHHDYDKYGASLSDDAQACAGCHGDVATGDNRVPLMAAYHRQCKGCHGRLNQRAKADLPVTCGRCHAREGAGRGPFGK